MRQGGALLLLQLLLWTAHGAPPARAATGPSTSGNERVVVQAPTTRPVLLQSMINPAVEAVIFQTPQFTLVPAAWAYISAETPLVLSRNFTISSQLLPPTVIDYSLLDMKVELQQGTNYLFDNVVLMNIRKLETFYFGFFLNSPGAVVSFHNVTIIDPICNATDPQEDLATAQALPHIPKQPRNHVSAAKGICLQLPTGQQCIDGGVFMHTLTVVVPSKAPQSHSIAYSPAEAAAAGAAGNFIIQYSNTMRVCRQYLDSTCLQQHGGNRTYCWEQQAAALLAAGGNSDTGSRLSGGAVAGAIIGGVVGLLCLLAAVLLLVRKHRHSTAYSSSSWFDRGPLPSSQGKQRSPQGGQGGGNDSQQARDTFADTSIHARGLGGLQQYGPLLKTADAVPRPSFGRDGLHLGVLLGAGSYGRVYKGRWHGAEVAIKIIHCLPEELPRVLREAEIMLQLEHPNIVRALNCVLHHEPTAKAAAAAAAAAAAKGDAQGSSGPHSVQAGTPGGGGSTGSSRRGSTTSSIAHMLPVLRRPRRASNESTTTQDHTPEHHATAMAARAGSSTSLGAAQRADSGAGSGLTARADSSTSAADQWGVKAVSDRQRQHSRQAGLHEVQVLPVVTTGSELCSTEGSSANRSDRQQLVGHLQQQQQQGVDDQNADEAGCMAEVWLVLELCTGGNLQDSFKQRNDAFDMARLLCRLAEVAQGMAYLHSKQIVHGDLKAANVLLVNSIHGSFGQIAKVTDLGLAGILREGVTHNSTQNLGTISHCAPELLQDGRVSPAADVYAFGVMMWELLTSRTAFKDMHYGTVIQRVVMGGQRPPVPPETPEDYALLMSACWAKSPADRPTFDQILECLTIMIQSLDAVTTTSGNVQALSQAAAGGTAVSEQQMQPQLPHAAAAAQPTAAAAPAAAASAHQGGSSSIGSFDMCRASSFDPSSSSLGASRLQLMSSGSGDLRPAQPRAEASAAAAMATYGEAGVAGGSRLGPTFYAKRDSAAPAAAVVDGSVGIGSSLVGKPPHQQQVSAGAAEQDAAGGSERQQLYRQHGQQHQQQLCTPSPGVAAAAVTRDVRSPGTAAAAASGGSGVCSSSVASPSGPQGSAPADGSSRGQTATPAVATSCVTAGDGSGGHSGTGGGGGGEVQGAPGSGASRGSSKLLGLQGPGESRHIQDLW